MPTSQTIRCPQAHRTVRPAGLQRAGDTRCKLYTMVFQPTPEREAILQEDLERLDLELAAIADRFTPDSHHAGFVLLHIGEHASWLLVAWWGDECLLHQRIYQRGFDEDRFSPEADGTIIGCTWELGVTAHERDAWCRHVLYNDAGPDIEAYLADTIEGPL